MRGCACGKGTILFSLDSSLRGPWSNDQKNKPSCVHLGSFPSTGCWGDPALLSRCNGEVAGVTKTAAPQLFLLTKPCLGAAAELHASARQCVCVWLGIKFCEFSKSLNASSFHEERGQGALPKILPRRMRKGCGLQGRRKTRHRP